MSDDNKMCSLNDITNNKENETFENNEVKFVENDIRNIELTAKKNDYKEYVKNVSSNGLNENYNNTLDEDVCVTIKRDLFKILEKLTYVIYPRFNVTKQNELKNWDLWGPLMLTLILCLTVSMGKNTKDSGLVFVSIFVIVFLGSIIISVNSSLLGSKFSLLQSMCVLGYCVFPINISALIVKLINTYKIVKFVIVTLSVIWSCFSSISFVASIQNNKKRFLTVFPICLYYFFLSWFVLTL